MKGVILAGGQGTRLRPLTHIMNKHMLPVGKYPMIHYAVEHMRRAGIADVLIITGKDVLGSFASYLGNGRSFGLHVSYAAQEEAGGIAQALLLAEPFIGKGERFVLLLGDNMFTDSLLPHDRAFAKQKSGARVLLKEVADPGRYGVAVMDGDRIVRIEEKPAEPKSNHAVVGVYFYSDDVFRIAGQLSPSARGELEITDVNNVYAARGQLHYGRLQGWWTDAGTFASLAQAARIMLRAEGVPDE